MSTQRNLSNGSQTSKLNIAQKKAYMNLIWESVNPDNVFSVVMRIQRIARGAKLKASEQVIINQLK